MTHLVPVGLQSTKPSSEIVVRESLSAFLL
jgi:hypothetical protein